MSRNQKAGRIDKIKNENSSSERVEEFRYLGKTLTKHSSVQEEIKNRLKSVNACYHSVQKLLLASLLSKNIKTTMSELLFLPVILYGFDTWSLTTRAERWVRVFENWGLRRIYGPKRDEVAGKWT